MANSESTLANNARQLGSLPGKPRIVFLHYSAPPVVGGVEAVIAEHVRLFHQAGFPTLIVAGRAAEETPQDLGPLALIPDLDSQRPENLKVQASLEEGTVPAEFRALEAEIEKGLRSVLRSTDILIAHNVLTHHLNLALTSTIHHLAGLGDFPALVVWCHDISKHVNPERDATQLHGPPWDLLRTLLPGATYVAVSKARQRTLASIMGSAPGMIEIIPNGVDQVQLLGLSALSAHLARAYEMDSADVVVLVPVRITRAKNLEFVLRVARALKREAQRVCMVITGPPDPHVSDIGDYFTELKSLRSELALEGNVHFVVDGTVGHPSPLVLESETVAALYRLADLVLMPSHREGFGIPVLEAGMVDRPVFATSFPITQELPNFQYLIGPHETPDSVARRILTWAASDSAHVLRKIVRREYTWDRIFRSQILPLVRRAAGAQPRDAT